MSYPEALRFLILFQTAVRLTLSLRLISSPERKEPEGPLSSLSISSSIT
jgi:hypothetical protein